MRRITEPSLHEVILHRVRPRSGASEPDLSDVGLDLTAQSPEVLDFIANHIKKGLNDVNAVSANFKAQDLDVAALAARLFDRDEFVDASRWLAQRLFEIAERDARIPDGTVAFVLYGAEPPTNPKSTDGQATFAGILKLDPSPQYRSSVEGPEGERRVTLTRVTGVLPSVRERLQKSAFLRPHDPAEDYQLLVLDRQTGGVANWFLDTFLESQPALDDAQRVDRFYRAVSQVEDLLRREGDEQAARGVSRARDQALRDETVNVDTFVQNRGELSDDQRAQLEEAILAGLPDTEFTVDRNRADRLLRKARFVGDHGLMVSVNQDSVDEVLDRNYNPETQRYEVTITTQRWEER